MLKNLQYLINFTSGDFSLNILLIDVLVSGFCAGLCIQNPILQIQYQIQKQIIVFETLIAISSFITLLFFVIKTENRFVY